MRERMGTWWLMRCSFFQCGKKRLGLASGDRWRKRGFCLATMRRQDAFVSFETHFSGCGWVVQVFLHSEAHDCHVYAYHCFGGARWNGFVAQLSHLGHAGVTDGLDCLRCQRRPVF